MLEDFVENSKIDAKIFVEEEEITSYKKLARICSVNEEETIKTSLYIGSNKKPFLAIYLSNTKPDFKKLCVLRNCSSVREALPAEAEFMTGYDKDALPPISIYGLTILIDKKVLEIKRVGSYGGTKNVALAINTKDIIETAWEEPLVCSFTL